MPESDRDNELYEAFQVLKKLAFQLAPEKEITLNEASSACSIAGEAIAKVLMDNQTPFNAANSICRPRREEKEPRRFFMSGTDGFNTLCVRHIQEALWFAKALPNILEHHSTECRNLLTKYQGWQVIFRRIKATFQQE